MSMAKKSPLPSKEPAYRAEQTREHATMSDSHFGLTSTMD